MMFETKQRSYRKFTVAPTLVWLLAMQSGCSGGPREVRSADSDARQADPVRPADRMPAEGVVPIPSGGTVVVSSSQSLAVVSEAISSQILFVDLQRQSVAKRISLRPGDQPGQCVEGSLPTEFFCVLRTGSAVIRVRADQQSDEPLQRSYVCHEPRGLAFAAADERLYVACDGGELVAVAATAHALRPVKTQQLEPGLHDVQLISGSSGKDSEIWVSRRRNAKVYKLSRTRFELIGSVAPVAQASDNKPTTASRLLRTPSKTSAYLLYQLGSMTLVSYGGGCINCDPTLMELTASGQTSSAPPTLRTASRDRIVAPLDMAVLPTGEAAVIAAGNRPISSSDGRTPLLIGRPDALKPVSAIGSAAMPVAVTATNDRFLVQTIGPAGAALWSVSSEGFATEISLGTAPQSIRPLELFFASHRSIGLACASCHPDGRDDGHIWNVRLNQRGTDRFNSRTMSLRGTLAGRSAFRRTGHFGSLQALVESDLENLHPRAAIDSSDVRELTSWLLKLPPVWNASDGYSPIDLARGAAVYQAHCASCHGTDQPSSSKQSLITGGPQLMAPFLVDVKNHAPYFTDGCAETLRQTIDGSCEQAGSAHSLSVTASEEKALLDYLLTR